MIDALSGFFDLLRRSDVAVAPAEAVEAVRALAAAGIESRGAVRAALALTCAKDRGERDRLLAAFDRYFTGPARRGAGSEQPAAESGSGGGRGAAVESAGPRPPARPPDRPGERRTAPLARRGEKRAGGTAPLVVQLERIARSRTARLRRLVLTRERGKGAALPGRDGVPSPAGLRAADLRAPQPPGVDRALVAEAARLIRELRLRSGRRFAPGARGRFAARRTLRRSLATGGVPMTLRFERRRPRRARLVVLLDVSRSVERAAGLFLVLAAGLVERTSRPRVHAFVDRPIECTAALFRWARSAGQTGPVSGFSAVLGRVPGLDLGAASDYGRTFAALAASGRPAGRDSILLVLGDGRTNRFDPQAWAFAELARRARAVLWLVPEPGERWGSGDSALAAYLPACDVVVECGDLLGLARGVRALGRELGRTG